MEREKKTRGQGKEKVADLSERQEHYDLAEMTEENRSSRLKLRESQKQWACCVKC